MNKNKLMGLACLMPLITACADLSYYMHSINGHYAIVDKTRPIKTLLADESTPSELKLGLLRVNKIRRFAFNELKLPESDSYSVYADLERDYVLKNLFAAGEFSVAAHRWCYPVVGCAGYRGYFDNQRLEDYSAQLSAQGFDIYVANVSAYSTLGWFDDPVLNTFINWPEYRLAGLIFHELAHQQLYVKGDTAFNESFATAVQQVGVEKWLQASGQDKLLQKYQQHLVNRQKVFDLIQQARESLKRLYATTKGETQKRQEKQEILHKLKQDYASMSQGFVVKDGFKLWFQKDLNNAQLASVATYNSLVPLFKKLLQQYEGNFESFYQQVKGIAGLPKEQRPICLMASLNPAPVYQSTPHHQTKVEQQMAESNQYCQKKS